MEMKEMCFYRAIGWLGYSYNSVYLKYSIFLDGDKMQKDNIFEHFDTLKDSNIERDFRTNVNECINWNADLGGSRKKRSIEEEQLGEVRLMFILNILCILMDCRRLLVFLVW